MLAAYGVDVLDPKVSLRRIHVLLQRLPPHARRGGEHWSVESELLAGVIDHLAMLTWVTLRANGSKNATKPKPVPRPGDRRREMPAALRQQQRPRPAAATSPADGPVATNSWFDAAAMMSGLKGVRTIGR